MDRLRHALWVAVMLAAACKGDEPAAKPREAKVELPSKPGLTPGGDGTSGGLPIGEAKPDGPRLVIDNGGDVALVVVLANGYAEGSLEVPPGSYRVITLDHDADHPGVEVAITRGGAAIHRRIDLAAVREYKPAPEVYLWSEGAAFDYTVTEKFYGTQYVPSGEADETISGRSAYALTRGDFFFQPLPDEIQVTGTTAMIGTAKRAAVQRTGDRRPAACKIAGEMVSCTSGDRTSVDLGPGWLVEPAELVVDLGGKGDGALMIDGVEVAALAAGKPQRVTITGGKHTLAATRAGQPLDEVEVELQPGSRYVFNPGGVNDYHVEEYDEQRQRWRLERPNNGNFPAACACGQRFFTVRTYFVLESGEGANSTLDKLTRGRAGKVIVPSKELAAAAKMAKRLPAEHRAKVQALLATIDPATASLCDVHRVRDRVSDGLEYPGETGLDDVCPYEPD